MDVSSFCVTNAQAAELVQPDERSFYDPPPSAQSAAVAVLRLASQARCGGRANLADCFRVITTVA